MPVLIQSAPNSPAVYFMPHHFDAACAYYGTKDLDIQPRLVQFSEVQEGKLDGMLKHNLAVGSVEFMEEVWKRLGIVTPWVPEPANRIYVKSTLGTAKKTAQEGKNIFIKPVGVKIFTGFVLDQSTYSSIEKLSDDIEVLIYDPFPYKILSEWRLYVYKHSIVDSRNYSGRFDMMPDHEYAKAVARKNSLTFPCAYTMDIALLENMETVVVEYNDFWAIGNYGLPNDVYVKMLKDRYFDILDMAKR